MDLNSLEELSLEYLSSQIDPINYGLMYSKILEENELQCEGLNVKLWIRLYSNRKVLILINEEFEEYIRSSFRVKTKKYKSNLFDIDISSFELNELENYIPESRLLCSNTHRIKSLNLVLYEQIVKTTDRFRLLMSIASKRYSGYWQSDLITDSKISPKDLFSLLNALSKLGLVYKLTIPQNRISKFLLNNINEACVIKYDNESDSQETPREGTPRSQNSASICFFHKYFVLDKLPKFIRSLCFGEATKNYESNMLEILEREENNIMLESDWKHSYFNLALQEVRQLNTRIENYLISRSYLSFRKSLEVKNKISLIFAWCPQTKKYERCIILIKNPNDSSLNIKSSNVLRVYNLKKEVTVHNESSEQEQSESTTLDLNRHSIQEYVYYIIKHSVNGITTKDINVYVPMKYKQLSKLLIHMESIGMIKKETERDGKVFMYRYYTTDHKKSMVKTELIPTNVDEGTESLTTPDKSSESVKDLGDKNYVDFLNVEKMKYLQDSSYSREFELLFGNMNFPNQINTLLFKRRMVLMNDYLQYFKAATFMNIANFYSDMEGNKTKPDRKSVMRVSDFVLKEFEHFKKFRCEEVKGANLSLTILFDSRYFNQTEAYNYIRNEINTKRNLMSIHTSSLKNKINDHFKTPEQVNIFKQDSIEIIDTTPDNKDITKLNIQVPCLVRDVSVNRQNSDLNLENSLIFSQKVLSSYGYIFPTMTRIKMLHLFLLENFPDQTFTTSEVLNKMTLENYFQLVGCGYTLPNVNNYVNEKVENLPEELLRILLNSRRDPINILNNQLNFLYRIKLLSFKPASGSYPEDNNEVNTLNIDEVSENDGMGVVVSKHELSWNLIKNLDLYNYVVNQVVGKFDLNVDFESYWQNFKLQVYNYLSSGMEVPPSTLPVKEIFSKKNWKKVAYLTNSIKSELDEIISIWLSLCCNSLDNKSLIKLIHIPFEIINPLSIKFNVTNSQIYSYILSKLRSNKYEPEIEDDRVLNKILTNIHKDKELLWISRYVISEKLVNRIFLKFLKMNYELINVTVDSQDVNNGESSNYMKGFLNFISKNKNDDGCLNNNQFCDIWNYLHLLFKSKYTINECKVIFDYIINNSQFNLRILKKLRKLKTNEIIRYLTKKSYGNVTHIYNTATTNLCININDINPYSRKLTNKNELLFNTAKLKCILFSTSSNHYDINSHNTDPKVFKPILKCWCDHRWIVRSKQKTHLFRVYKLSNLSKLKLFPKYSNISHLANQLLSYISLHNHDSMTNTPYYSDKYKETTMTMDLDLGLEMAFDINHVNPSFKTNNISVIKNCFDLDFYTIFNILENFTIAQFDPKWSYQSNREPLLRQGYSRYVEGGISKHIMSMTDSMSITKVRANITAIQSNLESQEYNDKYLNATVIPKVILCENDLSDILCPTHFNSLNLYSFDNRNDNEKNSNKINNLQDLIYHMKNLFRIDTVNYNVEELLYKFVKVVKDAEMGGITHTKVVSLLDEEFRSENSRNNRTSSGKFVTSETISNELVKLVSYIAGTLRLIVMVPNGKEFLYYYWEYNYDLFIKQNPFNQWIGNGELENVDKMERSYENSEELVKGSMLMKRPDYISDAMWLVWEINSLNITRKNVDSFITPLRDLLPQDLESYLHTLRTSSYNSFVKMDGHINVSLVGYISLRIFCIVNEKPGITAHQIWKDLVILDECEVQVLVESLVMENILKIKQLKVENLQSSMFESPKHHSDGVVYQVYYPQETSLVVWKFKDLLIKN